MGSGRRSGYWLLLLAPLLLGLACDRNIAKYDPGEQPQQPDLRRIFPAPEQASPPMVAAGNPDSAAPSGRPGAAVRGTIYLAEGVEPQPGAVLFVIARRRGAVGGPPLAALRIANADFPQAFELGPDQVMIPSMRFEGALSLSARLDGDGNAMTRDPADPQTRSDTDSAPGDMGISLVLDRVP